MTKDEFHLLPTYAALSIEHPMCWWADHTMAGRCANCSGTNAEPLPFSELFDFARLK